MLDFAAKRAPFYRELAERLGRPLQHDDLPALAKNDRVAHFNGVNTVGITRDKALEVGLAAEKSRDFSATIQVAAQTGGSHKITVGLSSGTSGQRGVFLLSDRENSAWAGTVLARLLPSALLRQVLLPWRKKLRISFVLRASSRIYETVNSARVTFRFHDLHQPLDSLINELREENADILVGPASVLAAISEHAEGQQLRPRLAVSVAEPLETADRELITRAFGCQVRDVYQTTEGLLALSCKAGKMHVVEEHVRMDFVPLGEGRFRPLITDLARTTQLHAKIELDDVILLESDSLERCKCGRRTRRLAKVEGRADEVLELPAQAGDGRVKIFPDLIRWTMVHGVDDHRWRIEVLPGSAQSPDSWKVYCNEDETKVIAALTRLAVRLGAKPPQITIVPYEAQAAGAKRVRIRHVRQFVE